MNLNDYAPSAFRKIMVYGPPKSGKTALVGKLAEKYTLHWFDLESGVKTLLNPAMLKPAYRENFRLFCLPDTMGYPIAAETLTKVIKGGTCKICHLHGKVSCLPCNKDTKPSSDINVAELGPTDILVIDSATQLANSAMNHITRAGMEKDPNYHPSWEDYRRQGMIMERIFSTIQQADFHIVVISHEALVEMEDKRSKLVPIGGTTNFSKTVAKYFDDVIYTEVVNKKHKAYSSSTHSNSILTGSRLGVELEKMEEASLLPLFQSAQ